MSGCHNRTMYDQCETENYHDKHVKCGNYRLEEFPYERNDCQKWSVDLETKFRLEPSNFLGGPGCGQAKPCFMDKEGFGCKETGYCSPYLGDRKICDPFGPPRPTSKGF